MPRLRPKPLQRVTPQAGAAIGVALVLLVPVWIVRGVILVDQPEARVGMKSYPLDLAYGAERPRFGGGGITPPFFQLPELTFPPGIIQFDPSQPGVEFCATAGQRVFPKEPAGFDLSGSIMPGTYAWKQKGTIQFTGLPALKAPAFAYRSIGHVVTADDGSITYEVTRPTLQGREVSTMRAAPGVGVQLVQLVVYPSNDDARIFAPVLPVTLLPFPVTDGSTIQSVGIDPINQRVMIVQGVVKNRIRVDACGEIFDGWLVQGTREFHDPDNPTAQPGTFDYAIAPQLGGLVIMDHLIENGTLPGSTPLPYTTDIISTVGKRL